MLPQSLLPLLALGHAAHAVARGPIHDMSSRNLGELNDLEARGLLDDFWKHLVDDIWEKLQTLKTEAACAGGEGILVLLQGLARLGDDPFVKVGQGLCKLAKVQDGDVCDGAVAREGPIIASALRKMDIGSDTSKAFCTTFLGVCGFPAVKPWNMCLPSPKPPGGRPQPGVKESIKIVHYSDLHVDPQYLPGSSANCTKPICCRPYTDADRPGQSKSPAGPNGDHKCDAPVSLEQSMYDAILRIVPDVAFFLFTGDIVDHGVWNTSEPYNTQSIERAYASMKQTGKLVYGTAGNHESDPVNSFQPDSVGSVTQWVYTLLSKEWSPWIETAAAAEAKQNGAYSTKYPGGNLRIISINTNLCDKNNFWRYQDFEETDPNGHLAWLVGQLGAAEKNGERVYIIGHLPLGEKDALPNCSSYLNQVLVRFSSSIAGLFFGHTHMDHFEVGYADYNNRSAGNAVLASYIAPSLVPDAGMPAFVVYDVDPETFGVRDKRVYIADMTDPAFQTSGPNWTEYYSAKEVYGKALNPPVTDPNAELTPAFWHNCTMLFEANNGIFNDYMSRRSRGWNVPACDASCKDAELCQMRTMSSQYNCMTLQPGIHFSRRDDADNVHVEHKCGVPVTRDVFKALTDSKENLQKLVEMMVEEKAKAGK